MSIVICGFCPDGKVVAYANEAQSEILDHNYTAVDLGFMGELYRKAASYTKGDFWACIEAYPFDLLGFAPEECDLYIRYGLDRNLEDEEPSDVTIMVAKASHWAFGVLGESGFGNGVYPYVELDLEQQALRIQLCFKVSDYSDLVVREARKLFRSAVNAIG